MTLSKCRSGSNVKVVVEVRHLVSCSVAICGILRFWVHIYGTRMAINLGHVCCRIAAQVPLITLVLFL